MGCSVSYATGSQVITFRHFDSDVECYECEGVEPEDCAVCEGTGLFDNEFMYDDMVDDFRDHLKHLFPSVTAADRWIGNEDHVLAENRLAEFGMSEYCGLVSYWIVPKKWDGYGADPAPLAKRWIDSIADKFIAAFGELTKVGSMSNGEGVYRQIRN